ncbi:MAG: hypothetical protein J6K19_04480 [Prevotella sp.]|nr:hypothetical protein [Prevotella sp.]
MATENITLTIPTDDYGFLEKLAGKMGWLMNIGKTKHVAPDALYDPETGRYLNEETMQVIRDAQKGINVFTCDSVDELLELAK